MNVSQGGEKADTFDRTGIGSYEVQQVLQMATFTTKTDLE